jgi:hypothetical protein
MPFPEEYRVMNHLDIVLFDKRWTAEEELLLLEGIEWFGFDWDDIADHIDTDKEPEDVQAHYEQLYMANEGYVPSHSVTSIQRVLPTPGNEEILDLEETAMKMGNLTLS